ncbi:MAG: hypothetical protein K2G41_04770 [Duncaniella sp.]|uniref:hypothetical protein n=1 Tax=Duncaniella sp. TaxID=2518496 RepID=UPI0023C64D8B|nr:hypothetical protein [Duncaniella sp.]MDE6089994.1 hypothetical protein [Duncaniella sp.]MDE6551406.1 hypothetical protein [Muribaculaceae bacterium]
MKNLKKTISDFRLRTSNQIKSWLQPRVGSVGRRYRLAARIRIANRWATQHPKRTFGYVVGTLLTVLFCDVAITGMRAEMKEPDVNMIANVEPVFNGFRTIQANKDTHRRTVLEMTSQGQTIKHELDSLIAIPHKSHSDSIGIIRRYGQLENLVKTLKQNDNE